MIKQNEIRNFNFNHFYKSMDLTPVKCEFKCEIITIGKKIRIYPVKIHYFATSSPHFCIYFIRISILDFSINILSQS
jgi:hypothetical protein